jgi:hypothetical protein
MEQLPKVPEDSFFAVIPAHAGMTAMDAYTEVGGRETQEAKAEGGNAIELPGAILVQWKMTLVYLSFYCHSFLPCHFERSEKSWQEGFI